VRTVLGLVLALLTVATVAVAPAAAKSFVYHLNAPPDLLDPAKCNNQRCRRVMWPIYEPLVDVSKDSRVLVPALAESWDVSADRLTYTFRLRRGVRFHDGSPFNASAAKISLERNFLPASPFYTADPPNVREPLLAGLVKSIEVKDEHTLVVTLKNPKVHILFLIPMVSPDALAKYGKQLGEQPVGTGPFKFSRRTADEIRLVANRDHWAGPPRLDELTFKIIPESEKTMQAFLAGRLDFLPEVEPVYLERIIASPAARLVRVPTLSIYYLGFRTDRKPFNDVRLRKAVTAAIDVERAVLFISRGMAIPAHGPIPPGVDAYDPELKKPRYRPDAARALLREAGHATGLRFSMVYNAGWGFFSELAQAIKSDLAKVGVAVDLVPKPAYKDLVADVRQGVGDAFIYSWFTILPDAEVYLNPLFRTNSVDNLTRYSSARLDALLEQARDAVDPARQLALYRSAQRVVVDDAPMAFLFHEIRLSAHQARVTGIELNPQSFPIDRFSRIDVVRD
jgi:peptide/nickel transport system substrate-binding protein